MVRFDCDPDIAFSTIENRQTPAYPGRAPLVNIRSRELRKSRKLTLDLLSDADALTMTEALDALARIWVLATRALPVKAEVERAAIFSERTVVVCCWVQEWSSRNCNRT